MGRSFLDFGAGSHEWWLKWTPLLEQGYRCREWTGCGHCAGCQAKAREDEARKHDNPFTKPWPALAAGR